MKLSIVIRCRNEAGGLTRVFEALRAQRCDFAWEVIVVDNQSTDNTRQLCAEMGAEIVSISQAEFTYGRALNLGISHARGELVLLLSAHAIPIGAQFLVGAVAPFEDPTIAAARCLMIGNPDQIASWYSSRNIRYASNEEQRAAETGTKWLGEYPTAGCCVLRRSVWETNPFDEQLEANEDKLWASQVLAQGHAIRCCAEAVWMYSRRRSPAAERNRRLREHVSLFRITGERPLGWWQFARLTTRAVAAAPWTAACQAVDKIRWYCCLVSVPMRAKVQAKSGSFQEFNQQH